MTKGRLALVGVALCALLLILNRPAPASGPPPDPFVFPPPGVTAIGSVAEPLAKGTRNTQGTIAKAVAAATARATPRSIAAARLRAQSIAAAAGLRLGDVYAVAPVTSGSYAWSSEPGTFGAGRYCGRSRRFSGYRMTPSGRRVRRYRQANGCRAPSEVTVNLSVSFSVVR